MQLSIYLTTTSDLFFSFTHISVSVQKGLVCSFVSGYSSPRGHFVSVAISLALMNGRPGATRSSPYQTPQPAYLNNNTDAEEMQTGREVEEEVMTPLSFRGLDLHVTSTRDPNMPWWWWSSPWAKKRSRRLRICHGSSSQLSVCPPRIFLNRYGQK